MDTIIRDEARAQRVGLRALNVPQTAHALGTSEFSVRELIREGRLRSVRVGRLIRVPVDAVDEFLAGSRRLQGAAQLVAVAEHN